VGDSRKPTVFVEQPCGFVFDSYTDSYRPVARGTHRPKQSCRPFLSTESRSNDEFRNMTVCTIDYKQISDWRVSGIWRDQQPPHLVRWEWLAYWFG